MSWLNEVLVEFSVKGEGGRRDAEGLQRSMGMSVPGISVWFLGELTCSGMCVCSSSSSAHSFTVALSIIITPHRLVGEVDPRLWACLMRFCFLMDDLLISDARRSGKCLRLAWHFKGPGFFFL